MRITKNQGLNNMRAAHAPGHAMPMGSSWAEVSCKVESNTKEWAPQSAAAHSITVKVWMFDTRQQTEKGTDTNGTHPGLVRKHAQTIYLEKPSSNFVASEKPASELNQWQSDPGLLTYGNFPKHLTQTTAAGGLWQWMVLHNRQRGENWY